MFVVNRRIPGFVGRRLFVQPLPVLAFLATIENAVTQPQPEAFENVPWARRREVGRSTRRTPHYRCAPLYHTPVEPLHRPWNQRRRQVFDTRRMRSQGFGAYARERSLHM